MLRPATALVGSRSSGRPERVPLALCGPVLRRTGNGNDQHARCSRATWIAPATSLRSRRRPAPLFTPSLILVGAPGLWADSARPKLRPTTDSTKVGDQPARCRSRTFERSADECSHRKAAASKVAPRALVRHAPTRRSYKRPWRARTHHCESHLERGRLVRACAAPAVAKAGPSRREIDRAQRAVPPLKGALVSKPIARTRRNQLRLLRPSHTLSSPRPHAHLSHIRCSYLFLGLFVPLPSSFLSLLGPSQPLRRPPPRRAGLQNRPASSS